jgi:hypothetical protein
VGGGTGRNSQYLRAPLDLFQRIVVVLDFRPELLEIGQEMPFNFLCTGAKC